MQLVASVFYSSKNLVSTKELVSGDCMFGKVVAGRLLRFHLQNHVFAS